MKDTASPGASATAFLRSLFEAAVAAADPALVLPKRLPDPPRGRTIVIGAGKAAASMARAVERHWEGSIAGLVVTRYGHDVPCERIEVVEAGHPLPDEAGRRAAVRMLAMVHGLTEDDLVICLISGGGSSLLCLPSPGVTLADKQAVSRKLLRSGATISEVNCVRKHLSAIKGGRLRVACFPARLVTYAISDVPGDDPGVIASGPTVPDPTTFGDALEVLAKYGVDVPASVRSRLRAGAAGGPGAPSETPKPGAIGHHRSDFVMLACPADALAAAAGVARPAGGHPARARRRCRRRGKSSG